MSDTSLCDTRTSIPHCSTATLVRGRENVVTPTSPDGAAIVCNRTCSCRKTGQEGPGEVAPESRKCCCLVNDLNKY